MTEFCRIASELPAHGLNARFPQAYFGGDRSMLVTEPSPVRRFSLDDAADAVIDSLRSLRGPRAHSIGGP